MTNENTKTTGLNPMVLRLVESAIMLGLATVLSLIKLYQMPLGGSVTLCSMLPILLIGYKYGVKWGLLTGFTYGVIQLLLDLA
uniref:energy-coupled thiamine transporter ThiT n=1 Tax=Caproicibacter sp. TaxID=2814884 RepID=UPI00398A3D32